MDSPETESSTMPLGAALGVKFFRYRNLVRRHWWILALTIGLGLSYEAYVALNKPQLFESVSRVNIREELIMDIKGGFADTTGNFFGTSMEQMRSPVLLGRAYDKMKLIAPQLNSTATITVDIAPKSNIMSVTGHGENAEFTQLYTQAVVDEFLALRAEGRNSTGTDVSKKLQEQTDSTKEELNGFKTKLRAFEDKNNMAFWDEQSKSSAAFLSGLKNKQAQLQNELYRLENLTPDQVLTTSVQSGVSSLPNQGRSGNAAVANGATTAPSAGGAGDSSFNSELYNEYLRKSQELSQRQADYNYWSTIWKPAHPKLQKIQDDIKSLQLAIQTVKDQNRESTASRIVTIRAELKSLEANIQTWDEKVKEAARMDSEHQALAGDVNRAQAHMEQLMAQMVSVTQGANTSPDPWVIMQKATPSEMVPRGTLKHLIVGLIGGLVVGIVILLVLDRSDDRLSSSSEMIEHFSEPIVGQIPDVSDARTQRGLSLLQLEDERYTYAEAFRSLRSSLIFMPNQREMKTLLVTSAIPNEGKSTITSNLAVTMAAAGAKVLVVDADLRRGDLAELFGVESKTGLSNILRGEVDWKKAIIQTDYPTLSLITRGPVTNQSGELLLRPNLIALLDQFKLEFDLTIFNTAPILATDDTPTLAPNFDGALMVVRAQFTSARLTKNALNALYQRQVNVLGLILNRLDTETPDYYYYRYPKYYAA